jgi:uncharacterized membrane protein YkvA (DUF1232 family)
MKLRLTVDLSDTDLDYYRGRLLDAWKRGAQREKSELVSVTRQLLEQLRGAGLSEAVQKRLDDLGDLASMLEDEEWAPEGEDHDRIVAAMSYFADPIDAIPDNLPGLGYLDDALMAELVVRELRHDLDAYRDFCRYRAQQEQRGFKKDVNRKDWLAAKRRQLFMRMRRRRKERRRHRSPASPTPSILQYR